MNLGYLVWQYLKARPLNTALNIVLLGLGTALITVLVLANLQLQRKIEDNAKGIDLVIGAKGSPMQLILSSIFHVDVPTGNIKVRDAEKFARGALVKNAIPLALGDNFKSFRIVGTNRGYARLYDASLSSGAWWRKGLEAVIGHAVAEKTGLKPGDSFVSSHGIASDGHQHDAQHYTVTGIMAATGSILDELILTSVETVWAVHDLWAPKGGDLDSIPVALRSTLVPVVMRSDSTMEITSMLVQYRSALAAVQLPRLVNANSAMQAASPAFETARLFSIVGAGVDLFMAFAYLLIVIAGMSVFIALYNSLRERRYDIAIMRTMGASRFKVLVSVVIEGICLTLLGSLLGIVLGHTALMIVPFWLEQTQKAGITGWYFDPVEFILLAGSILLGLICALIPAIQAYRTDISDVLAGNG